MASFWTCAVFLLRPYLMKKLHTVWQNFPVMSTPGLGDSQTQFPQSQWPRPKHTGPRRVPFLFVKVGLHLRSGSSFSSGVPFGHLKKHE